MKVIVALLMSVVLYSCTQVSAGSQSAADTRWTVVGEIDYNKMFATEFSYKGHSYILFHVSGGWDGANGIVHNPDCRCNKK